MVKWNDRSEWQAIGSSYSNYFDANDGRAICNTLGMTYSHHNTGYQNYHSYFSAGTWQPYGLMNIKCNGNELSIEECPNIYDSKVNSDYGSSRYIYMYCTKGNSHNVIFYLELISLA